MNALNGNLDPFETQLGGFLMYLSFAILVAILLVFGAREFWCWYFKINKIVDLLEDIKRNTASGRRHEDKTPGLPS